MPDAACQGLTMATTFYAANTAQPLSYSFAQSFDQIAAAHQQSLGRFAPENLYVRLHTLQANEGVSNLLLLSLVGTYAGGILMISCLTLLAVQQLTDARQQRRRFQTAIHLGMAAEDRDQVVRPACGRRCAVQPGRLGFFHRDQLRGFYRLPAPVPHVPSLRAGLWQLSSSAALLLYRHISSVPAGHGRPMIFITPTAVLPTVE